MCVLEAQAAFLWQYHAPPREGEANKRQPARLSIHYQHDFVSMPLVKIHNHTLVSQIYLLSGKRSQPGVPYEG